LILLAIGVSVLLWAAARMGPAPADSISTMSAVGPCLLADCSHGHGDSDQHWQTQDRTIAAVSASVWKSAPVHAALAAVLSARAVDTPRPSRPQHPSVRSGPLYLRHTPLLI
jgi:hypothetical protein